MAAIPPSFLLLSDVAQNRQNLIRDLPGRFDPFRFGYIFHVEDICT